ncbi:glycosyltransferase family 4 protein [Vulcanococcus sp.]|jgi:starch synthase|uniref:glycosyltransferase family 4 protein n=1 Tax=Vulcanococcus sp. TaxID=2856995 RepID=UPI0037D9A730
MPELTAAVPPVSSLFPAALLLPGDAFDTDQFQVLGRRVAGRSMARGLCAHLDDGEELTLLVSSEPEARRLKELLEPALPSGARLRLAIGFHRESFQAVGALHVPDPGLARWEMLRAGQPANRFSITGVIHTLCSESVFNAMADLVTAPLQPWDALVCTSRAGRSVVQAAMDHRHQALERRFGQSLPRPAGPQLPLIPLAVEEPLQPLGPVDVLDPGQRDALRRQARSALQLPASAFVLLFLGRLSFHSKAHPLPLYRAVARLMHRHPGHEVILLECGHLFNSSVAEAYDQLQQDLPQLQIRRLGGLQPATEHEKALALAAADLFVSPADNLQETFGLSVIEAMAAALPTVVSDWDGYKDLVHDGVTGIRVPIRTAFAQRGRLDPLDRSYRLGLIDYDNMIGVLSLAAVVEEDALLQSLERLLLDPGRRQTMGIMARHRWQQHFCWSVVQRQYRDLWLELAALRQAAGPLPPSPPAQAPMADLFAGYGTEAFAATRLICTPGSTPASFLERPMVQLFSQLLCGGAHGAVIRQLSDEGQISDSDLERLGVPAVRRQAVLAMLVKLGIARVCADAS